MPGYAGVGGLVTAVVGGRQWLERPADDVAVRKRRLCWHRGSSCHPFLHQAKLGRADGSRCKLASAVGKHNLAGKEAGSRRELFSTDLLCIRVVKTATLTMAACVLRPAVRSPQQQTVLQPLSYACMSLTHLHNTAQQYQHARKGNGDEWDARSYATAGAAVHAPCTRAQVASVASWTVQYCMW